MQVVVFLLEKHICHSENHQSAHQIPPVRRNGIGAQINESQRHGQLHTHVDASHHRMRHLQLIRHQLIRMLPVSLAQILVQQDAVAYGQNTVHAVHQQEDEIRHVAGGKDKTADHEQENVRDSNRTDVARKALRLATWSEIEDAENHVGQRHHDNQRHIHEPEGSVEDEQRHQRCHSVRACNAVDAIHEIDDVRCPHAHDQRQNHHPPHIQMQDIQLIEHHCHGNELRHQSHAVRQRMNIINKTDACNQRYRQQEPDSGKSEKRSPNPEPEQKDDSTAPEDDGLVRRPLVRLVDDVELVGNLKIDKFQG